MFRSLTGTLRRVETLADRVRPSPPDVTSMSDEELHATIAEVARKAGGVDALLAITNWDPRPELLRRLREHMKRE